MTWWERSYSQATTKFSWEKAGKAACTTAPGWFRAAVSRRAKQCATPSSEKYARKSADISPFDIKLLDDPQTDQSEKVLRDTNEKVLVDMRLYDFVVQADKPADKIPVKCDDDIVEAAWHPISELSKLELSPPTKARLQSLGYL